MKEIFHQFSDKIIDILLWVVVGLMGITGFFGRRMMKRWDNIVESHVPGTEIDKRFQETNEAIEKYHKEVLGVVSDVHNRVDDLYLYLATGRQDRRTVERDKKGEG